MASGISISKVSEFLSSGRLSSVLFSVESLLSFGFAISIMFSVKKASGISNEFLLNTALFMGIIVEKLYAPSVKSLNILRSVKVEVYLYVPIKKSKSPVSTSLISRVSE